jgi:DNA invertase Pin-like site-specific DNA recombinase
MATEILQPVVTIRPPTLNPFGKKELTKRLNSCGYARVSSDKDEQESSFERQCEYYESYIKRRPDLNYVGLYADPACSGTRAEKRPKFMKMIEDCRAGLIDKIFVKSVARFARNTEQALHYIKELKELGVSIFFETEGIDTLTPGGEILLTILAGMAEQESRTISKNICWAYEKKFAAGGITMPTKFFLGYTRDKDKNIVVNPREAVIVQRIYKEYLGGYPTNAIAAHLQEEGIQTPGGKTCWTRVSILKILTNLRYTGNCIMGKTYKPDVLSPKRVKNEGQRKQYYIQNSHPAIIDQETFDLVQAEYARRSGLRSHTESGNGRYSSKYIFSGKLICGECGSKLRRHKQGYMEGRTPYADWICINKQVNKACGAVPIKESELESAFVSVMQSLIQDREVFTANLKANISAELSDNLIEQIEKFDIEITKIQAKALNLNKDNSSGLISDAAYDAEIERLENESNTLKRQRGDLELRNERVRLTKYRIEEIDKALSAYGNAPEFNESIFADLIDCIKIYPTTLDFKFKCGIEPQYKRK